MSRAVEDLTTRIEASEFYTKTFRLDHSGGITYSARQRARRRIEMAGSGRRVAGIVAVVLAVLAAVAGILNYMGHHPRRGIAAIVACAVLLILGIVLIAVAGRKSPQTPSQ